jgi:hemoglobin-like flavoprotein
MNPNENILGVENDVEQLVVALTNVINYMISSVDRLDLQSKRIQFKESFVSLAERNYRQGITSKHYPIIGNALFVALRTCLGPELWNEATSLAWYRAYSMVLDVVLPVALYEEAQKALSPRIKKGTGAPFYPFSKKLTTIYPIPMPISMHLMKLGSGASHSSKGQKGFAEGIAQNNGGSVAPAAAGTGAMERNRSQSRSKFEVMKSYRSRSAARRGSVWWRKLA